MPFAINDVDQFISPTKTPEYLAGGKPVVSTPISDVVRHYGQLRASRSPATPDEFVAGCEEALELAADGGDWLAEVDQVLGVDELGHHPGAHGRPDRRGWSMRNQDVVVSGRRRSA